MKQLDEKAIRNVIWGAALLGGGGGGSLSAGENMLEAYMNTHPEIILDLIDPAEMDENSFVAVTAGIGEPSAIGGDFSPYANNAFAALNQIFKKQHSGESLKYSMAVELGGFNTFVAMLIALEQGIPLVDSDCCARAVPALDTTLFSVTGNTICPLAMADEGIRTELIEDKDAAEAESIARGIAVDFGGIAGISGWIIQKDAIQRTLPSGSISICQNIGAILRNKDIHPIEKWAKMAEVVPCRYLFPARTAGGKSTPDKGFDVGYVEFENQTNDVSGPKIRHTSYFQNETMLITGPLGPIMTVPDIIGMFNLETCEPLSNADLFDKDGNIKDVNLKVSVGLIQVDKKWRDPGIDLDKVWGPHLNAAYPKYTGGIIPYPGNKG